MTCFICLNKTTIRKCNICTLKCHYKCWTQYLKFATIIKKNQLKCPQCNTLILITKNSKRLQHKNQIKNKNYIKCIKKFIAEIETHVDVKSQLSVLKNCFTYIYKNNWFLVHHYKFKNTVRSKLLELYTLDNWFLAPYFYKKIFNESIQPTLL